MEADLDDVTRQPRRDPTSNLARVLTVHHLALEPGQDAVRSSQQADSVRTRTARDAVPFLQVGE